MGLVAVLFAPGFEEAEALTIVDILRRAGREAVIAGLRQGAVTGGHGITVQTDTTAGALLGNNHLDMVILPGGYPGVEAMLSNDDVLSLLRQTERRGKLVGAMCAAPLVLEKAGLLAGKRFTAYRRYEAELKTGRFTEDIVVRDGNLITARGPATVYAFSYALLDALGADSSPIKQRMLYDHSFKGGQAV